jgi:hypothetical protein
MRGSALLALRHTQKVRTGEISPATSRPGEKPGLISGKGTETERASSGLKGRGSGASIDFGDWLGPQGPVNTISDEEIDHKRSGSE